MIKIFAAVLLIGLVVSHEDIMVGSNKCTWGPAYWCDSIENAKECNTQQHCMEKVWVGDHPLAHLTKPIPEDSANVPAIDEVSPQVENVAPVEKNGGNCALCKMIANKVLDYMKDNKTEAEILSELESFCQWCPDKDNCVKYVEEYGAEFIKFILEAENADDLCRYLGLCSQEFLNLIKNGNVLVSLIGKRVGDIGCDTCSSLMGLVQTELKTNKDQIEQVLNGICQQIPVDQKECDQFIDTIFEGAVAYFLGLTPKEACQEIGLCAADFAPLVGITPVKLDDAASDELVF